jgi:putative spermidine/putrescine transport system permease protein
MMRRFRTQAGALPWTVTVVTVAFLVLPLLAILPISFSENTLLTFPPKSFSLQWYRAFFDSPEWTDALLTSLKLGAIVGFLSTALGYLAAVALTQERMPAPVVSALRSAILIPLIVPVIVIAIAVYRTFAGFDLVGTTRGIVLAHTVLALPVTFVIIEARLQGLGRVLMQASASLGASWWQTTRFVTLPLVAPALLAASVFGFFTSFDEVVIVNFIGGPDAQTLPRLMFASLRSEIQPTIAAAASLVVSVWLIGFLAVEVVASARRRRAKRLTGGNSGVTLPIDRSIGPTML